MSKNFFAQLAGVSDNGDECKPKLVSTANSKAKKTTKKKKNKEETIDMHEISNNVINDDAIDLVQEEFEIDDEFDDLEGQLTIDVYQDNMNVCVESPVAGVDADNLDIAITPESVAIHGKRKRSKKIEKENYLHQECFWGSFSRSIILPQEIDPDKAKASIKNGVLKIVLPKVNRSKSKRLEVKID